MDRKQALVVNLIGGPCSGKSTIAAELFARLKKMGIRCELVTEYIKERIYEENKTMKMQNIILENRNKLHLSGVLDVLNFDEEIVTVDKELGVLVIKGSDLRLNKFNLENEELNIDGEVISMTYDNKSYSSKKGEGLLTKIFK